MKKLLVGLTLVAFLIAGAVSVNSVKANPFSLDVKIDKVQVDKDPTKDNDKDKKKDSKATSKTTSSSKKSSSKEACSDKKTTSCSGQKTSCCSKSKPDKK